MIHKTYTFFHNHYKKNYRGVYRHAKQLFFFDLVLLATAITLFAFSLFFFFWKPGIADQVDLVLSLGTERIKSGEAIRLTVRYTNNSELTLNDPVLALRLPKGFIIDRNLTPTTTISTLSTLALPSLHPGAEGETEIFGRYWQNLGTSERVSAILSYIPENRVDREQKFSSLIAQLPESVLKSELETPSSTFVNAAVPFAYRLTNTSDVPITGIGITSNHTLELGTEALTATTLLLPGETKTVTGTLRFRGSEAETPLQFAASVTVQGTSFVQNRASRSIRLITPVVHAAAKWQPLGTFVSAGDTVPLQVSWENRSGFSLKHSKIRLTFTPGTVNIRETARLNSIKAEGESLVIDGTSRTSLNSGATGLSDSVVLNIKLLSLLNLKDAVHAKLEVTPTFEASVAGLEGQLFKTAGEKTDVPVATELLLNTSVRYYTDEGDQLGRGPLPPTVGETTKYWVFVQMTNTTNEISDANFEATLAPGVTFSGRQSVTIGPELAYNPASNFLSWHYRELPPHSQTGFYFEVAVTPRAGQVGTTLELVKTISVRGVDEVVGKNLSATRSNLKNILPSSDRGSRFGAEVIAE